MTELTKLRCAEVLLATYNGERYLREQIDSILGQDYPDLKILAWDDGSSDNTASILEEYAASFPERLRVLSDGTATGHPKWNFLRLIKASTADYICFADQDDIWIPEKVSLSVQTMLRMETKYGRATPLLVFTDAQVVDEQLKTIHPSFWKQAGLRTQNIHKLSHVLRDNAVAGCTAMINRSMCNLAVHMPEEAQMHDWWIALLAATFGRAEALPQCTVLYRQHDSSANGSKVADTSLGGFMRMAWGSHRRRRRLECERQVEGLLRVHGEQMTVQQRKVLGAYLLSGRSESAWKRVGTMVSYGLYRTGFLKNIATIVDLVKWRSTDKI